MGAKFTTLQKPNRTRPYLLQEIASVIVSLEGVPQFAEVTGTTRVMRTHVAKFVWHLKKLGIMEPDEQIQVSEAMTVDQVLEQLTLADEQSHR